MKLLKCADCGKEISITADKCPNCGSEKQFKGYIFYRKELAKEKITPMEMMRFQKHGGKIKILNWKKLFQYGGITFVVLLVISQIIGMQEVEYTQEDGTVISVSVNEKLALEEKKRDKEKEKSLLDEIGKTKMYNYKKLEDIYSTLSNLRENNKEYSKKAKYYKLANDSSSKCVRLAHKSDKSRLSFPDSFDIKIDGKEAGLWSSEKEYVYQYSFGFKNAYGMERVLFSRYYCYYDDNFNVINIKRAN
jgi:hypothetical protein